MNLSKEGDVFEPGQEPLVAPGVRAIVFDAPAGIYISWISAEREGSGDVGRFLDSLPKDRRVVVPNVISNRLARMLERRGFEASEETAPEFGTVDIFERLPAPAEKVETFILKVGGESFRCESCRSNCFHRYDSENPLKYECNGCGARYEGEKGVTP